MARRLSHSGLGLFVAASPLNSSETRSHRGNQRATAILISCSDRTTARFLAMVGFSLHPLAFSSLALVRQDLLDDISPHLCHAAAFAW